MTSIPRRASPLAGSRPRGPRAGPRTLTALGSRDYAPDSPTYAASGWPLQSPQATQSTRGHARRGFIPCGGARTGGRGSAAARSAGDGRDAEGDDQEQTLHRVYLYWGVTVARTDRPVGDWGCGHPGSGAQPRRGRAERRKALAAHDRRRRPPQPAAYRADHVHGPSRRRTSALVVFRASGGTAGPPSARRRAARAR